MVYSMCLKEHQFGDVVRNNARLERFKLVLGKRHYESTHKILIMKAFYQHI